MVKSYNELNDLEKRGLESILLKDGWNFKTAAGKENKGIENEK